MKNKSLNTFHVATPEQAMEHGVMMELTDGETVIFQFMRDGRILTNSLRGLRFEERLLETIQKPKNIAINTSCAKNGS